MPGAGFASCGSLHAPVLSLGRQASLPLTATILIGSKQQRSRPGSHLSPCILPSSTCVTSAACKQLQFATSRHICAGASRSTHRPQTQAQGPRSAAHRHRKVEVVRQPLTAAAAQLMLGRMQRPIPINVLLAVCCMLARRAIPLPGLRPITEGSPGTAPVSPASAAQAPRELPKRAKLTNRGL